MRHMTLDLPEEIDARLTDIACRRGITKAEAMRRAFALLSVADREKANGNSLAVVKEMPDHSLEPVARLVGIF